VWEEEHPVPGYQAVTERYVVWQFVGLGVASSWLAAAEFAGGYATCAAIAAITVFHYLFLTREPIIPAADRRRHLLLWSLAPLALFGIWLVGQFFPSIHNFTSGDETFLTPSAPPAPSPTTGLPWRDTLFALYAPLMLLSSMGFTAAIVSRFAVARILWLLFFNAIILAAAGAIVWFMRWQKILGFLTPTQENFFSAFPSGSQWAAFALFWVIVGFGVLFHLKRRRRWFSLLEHNGGWLLLGWALLVWSVYETGAPIHRSLLGLTFGVIGLMAGFTLVRRKRNRLVSGLLGLLLGLAGFALTITTAAFFAQELNQALEDPAREPFGAPFGIQTALWRDAWSLFLERPWFGWGAGSFSEVFLFHQQVDLGDEVYESPHSDFLLALVEFGLVGVVVWLLYPVAMLVAYFRLRSGSMLSRYLWAGAAVLGLLSLVSQPLSSPANLACFFLAFPAACKWTEAPVTKTALFGRWRRENGK